MAIPGDRGDNETKKFDEVNGNVIVKVKVLEDDVYSKRLAYTGDSIEYVGEATPGTLTSAASWKIKKLVYTGSNITSVIWAD